MFNQYFLNKNIEVKKTTKLFKLCLNNFVVFLILISIFIIPVNSVQSAFNQEINYQGKLTDSAGENVTDGDYNMEFNLYTTSTSTSAIWTETLTLTNKVTVTSGLFSVLLGNVTTIAGVDFNQDIYLGVNIGGSGTASWDGEMTPRKQIASVPSAFESEQLNGQPASYYLDADNLTNFGNPFYTFFNATTTDALSEGSTNQYWTNDRFDTRLSATTTLPNLTTLLGLTNASTTQLTSTTSWLGNLLVTANSISATNNNGLTLYDNSNNGISILDGGNVFFNAVTSLKSSAQIGDFQHSLVDKNYVAFQDSSDILNGNLTHVDSDDQGDYANNVWGDGKFIYLANDSGGLHTYSVDNSGTLTHIDSDDQGGNAKDVWGDGNYIYLANNTGGLHIYSVDDSGVLTHIDSDDQGDLASSVWGDGKFIYLANGGGGLHTYSVDNSGNLTHIDSDNQGDDARGVWGDGKFIYLANDSEGLRIYSIDDSGILTHIDFDDQGDNAYDVWGDGKFIYLANSAGGLHTYSVNDSGVLTHIDSDDQGDNAYGVWGDGKYIYLANVGGGLHTYSVDDSGVLTHIDFDDQGDAATSVWGDGKFIYLANHSGGLHTYSVNKAYQYDKANAQHEFVGNVGIGTTTPAQKLSVAGLIYSGTGGFMFPDGTTQTSAVSSDITLAHTQTLVGNSSATATATSTLTILDSGYVGIGTATPTEGVDVAGKIAIDGVARIYIPDQTDFVGTMYLGNGGVNLSHTGAGDGQSNTFVGISSGNANTIGYQNTANGSYSLHSNTIGNDNTANGSHSLYSNSTGSSNTANGQHSLYFATGDNNTASGYYALTNVTEGIQNTAIGYNTGLGITTGDYNTILGANVTGLSADLSNNIIIADGQGNQRINVDSSGNVGIGTTSPVAKLSLEHAIGNDGLMLTQSNQASGYEYLLNIRQTEGLIFQRWLNGSFSANVMTLDYNGNVGIGTTSPGYKLEIAGGSIGIPVTSASTTYGLTTTNGTTKISNYQGLDTSGNSYTILSTNRVYGVGGWTSTGYYGERAGSSLQTSNDKLLFSQFEADSNTTNSVFEINSDGDIIIANDNWISARNDAGTDYINMFKVNTDDEIDVGAGMNIGSMTFSEDSGFVTAMDLPVSSTPTVGDVEAYAFKVDGDNILTIYAEADGAGGIQNKRVGIGDSSPSYQLELSTDSAAKPGTSSWTVASDERLKDINGDFTRGLDTLAGLYPVYFNYKTDNALDIPSDREYVGLIAQDVQTVIPEAVRTGIEGFLSIESDAIFWTMLNAIKELGLKVGSDNITYTRDTLQVINGTGEAQMKLAYDEENLAEFNVSATGDLALSTAGKDIRLPDDNLSICSGGACPTNASIIEGTGNLVVENTAYIAGSLGIGTSEPQRIVDIYESQSDPQMRISYDDDLYSEFNVSATGDLIISAQGGDISVLNENLRVCSDEGCPSIINEIENRGNLIVENSILALGNVGIGGTVSPDYTLDVQGTLRAYGITDASDRRLKTNIQTIDNPNTLENIQKLRGVTFEWKNSDFGTGTQVGMIAQELEEVYPDLVETDNDGFKSIQYGKFTAILLEAVKDLIDFGQKIEYRSERLEGRTTELERKNAELEEKTQNLEARLEALEDIFRR